MTRAIIEYNGLRFTAEFAGSDNTEAREWVLGNLSTLMRKNGVDENTVINIRFDVIRDPS